MFEIMLFDSPDFDFKQEDSEWGVYATNWRVSFGDPHSSLNVSLQIPVKFQ